MNWVLFRRSQLITFVRVYFVFTTYIPQLSLATSDFVLIHFVTYILAPLVYPVLCVDVIGVKRKCVHLFRLKEYTVYLFALPVFFFCLFVIICHMYFLGSSGYITLCSNLY